MKKTLNLIISLFLAGIVTTNACDRTSISITNVTYDGTTYWYTAEVCLGITPNWGETNSFSIAITGACATSLATTSFTSSYNYCTATLAFNGQGCATTAMGAAPAGGTVQTANVNVNGSVGGGGCSTTYNFSGSGGAIGPDDLDADCADCGNPTQLCWDITFGTDAPITSAQLVGAEGNSATCPDEIDTTIPAAPPACSLPVLSTTTINGGASATICEGASVSLASSCSSNCTGGSFSWTGPNGFSGSGSTDSDAPTSSGTYTATYSTSGTCFTTATVNVTVQETPTAALNTAIIDACASAQVPVTFTGAGPYTFSYLIDGGSQTSVTTSSNPYYIPVSSNSTISFYTGSMASPAGVESGACPGTIGTVSGTTDVNITTVDADAGTDVVGLINTNYTLSGSGTPGLDGYDTTSVPSTTSNSTSSTITDNDPTGYTAPSISLSSLGLSCTTYDINNISDTPVCFTFSTTPGSNLVADLCYSGGGCINVPLGGISGSPYCFSRGDIFNLLSGVNCNSGSLTLTVSDQRTSGGGPNASNGTFTGWSVTLNDFTTTIKPNPTYTWTAVSGTANVGDLSCTDCATPTFNTSVDGAGCFDLTVTDGFGCTSVDQVCYDIVLSQYMSAFDVKVLNNNKVELNWKSDAMGVEAFVVERSTNGDYFEAISEKITFTEIGDRYGYVDLAPLRTAQYRIKVILEDGGIDYSIVRDVYLGDMSRLKIERLYPNPVNEILQVDVKVGRDSDLFFSLINLSGEVVYKREVNQVKGTSVHEIPFDELNSGTYMLMISGSEGVVKSKIVKE